MPNVARDASARLVRVVDSVADEPASVLRRNHLARWFLATQNRALNDSSQLLREDPAPERKGQEPEHLAVLVQGAHGAHSGALLQASLPDRVRPRLLRLQLPPAAPVYRRRL
jgi:hypothetical protein